MNLRAAQDGVREESDCRPSSSTSVTPEGGASRHMPRIRSRPHGSTGRGNVVASRGRMTHGHRERQDGQPGAWDQEGEHALLQDRCRHSGRLRSPGPSVVSISHPF